MSITEPSLDALRKEIDARVQMVEKATSRSRWTLAAISVVAASIALTMFDYMLSWNKDFALGGISPGTPDIQKEIVSTWLSTQIYNVPLLGIKVMASDFPLVAPPALAVFSTWFFFCLRREHYTVVRILADAYRHMKTRIERDADSLLLAQSVYHRVIAQMVFNVVTLQNKYGSLTETVQPAVAGHVSISDPVRLNRSIIHSLVWLPFLTIGFVVAIRILTFVVIASPVSGHPLVLAELSDRRVALLALSFAASTLSAIVVFRNARQTLGYERETRNLLNKYQQWAFAPKLAGATKPAADGAPLLEEPDPFVAAATTGQRSGGEEHEASGGKGGGQRQRGGQGEGA
jgi:hypothetical protein